MLFINKLKTSQILDGFHLNLAQSIPHVSLRGFIFFKVKAGFNNVKVKDIALFKEGEIRTMLFKRVKVQTIYINSEKPLIGRRLGPHPFLWIMIN